LAAAGLCFQMSNFFLLSGSTCLRPTFLQLDSRMNRQQAIIHVLAIVIALIRTRTAAFRPSQAFSVNGHFVLFSSEGPNPYISLEWQSK
jgi:hypothetical protein